MEEEDGEEAVLQTMQMTSIETENVMSSEKDILREEITLPDKISSWKRFQQKIKQIFRKIRSFFQTLSAKVRSVYSNFSKWKGIFTDEANRASVRLFYSEIKYLAFHYKPRRLKADIRYGLGDPALTGKSLAVLSMIPFLYKKKVQIVPDFETEKFFVEGNLDAGGYIRIFHLIRSGLHMADNTFNSTVESLFKGMDSFITTKTVVGDAIYMNDTIILPLVDVSFGVGAGAFAQDKKNNGAGGMGGKITPSAVLVIQNGTTKLVNIKNQDGVTKLLDMVPDFVNKFTSKGDKTADAESGAEDIISEDAKTEDTSRAYSIMIYAFGWDYEAGNRT